MPSDKIKIAVAKGDGIGPEIMDAVLNIFNAAQVPFDYDFVGMGKSVYEQGYPTGMTDEAKASVESNGILFKGPMETPKGGGVKSINVTARKTWNTHSNIRVFRTIPGVDTVFSKANIPIDITVVRENIEDTYGGIEHQLTPDVSVGRRLISRPGSEQVIRSAFETAKKEGYKRVTCSHKANIMKITDGMFLDTFYEVAKEYPQIEADDVIVDALCMNLVKAPQHFEVIVLPNLQGDIVSDLCAGLVGGLGFAPSANLGDYIKIFEAVHGTAPDIAGQNLANPTSLLMSGLMMLRQMGLKQKADVISNALQLAIKDGIHTGDFGAPGTPSVGTSEFAQAIIDRFDQEKLDQSNSHPDTPEFANPKSLSQNRMLVSKKATAATVGIDYFIGGEQNPKDIAATIQEVIGDEFELVMISNRGTMVWPEGSVYTDMINQFRARVEVKGGGTTDNATLWKQAVALGEKLNICSLEMLMTFDGKRGYSLGQGQKSN